MTEYGVQIVTREWCIDDDGKKFVRGTKEEMERHAESLRNRLPLSEIRYEVQPYPEGLVPIRIEAVSPEIADERPKLAPDELPLALKIVWVLSRCANDPDCRGYHHVGIYRSKDEALAAKSKILSRAWLYQIEQSHALVSGDLVCLFSGSRFSDVE